MKTLIFLFLSLSVYAQSILIEPSQIGDGASSVSATTLVSNRLRLKSNIGYTAGLWMNNSANSTSIVNGAFWGMKNDLESGVWIGNSWRFWINTNGKLFSTSLAGTGTRLVYANADGSLSAGTSEKIHAVSALNFKARSSNPNHRVILSVLDVYGTPGETFGFVSPLEIENGAIVNKIEIEFKQYTASTYFKFSLFRLSKFLAAPSSIADVQANLQHPYFQLINMPLSEIIDNDQYNYFIYFDPVNSSGSPVPWIDNLSLTLKGYKVYYSL